MCRRGNRCAWRRRRRRLQGIATRATELELRRVLGAAVRAGARRRGRRCSGCGLGRLGIGWRSRLGWRSRRGIGRRLSVRRLSVCRGLCWRGRSVGRWRRSVGSRRVRSSLRGSGGRRVRGRRRRSRRRSVGSLRGGRGRTRGHGSRRSWWHRWRRDHARRRRRTRSLSRWGQLGAAAQTELVVVLVFLAAVWADDHKSLTRSRRGRVVDRRTDSRRGTAPAHP
jgi:hypothetical protein